MATKAYVDQKIGAAEVKCDGVIGHNNYGSNFGCEGGTFTTKEIFKNIQKNGKSAIGWPLFRVMAIYSDLASANQWCKEQGWTQAVEFRSGYSGNACNSVHCAGMNRIYCEYLIWNGSKWINSNIDKICFNWTGGGRGISVIACK